MSYLQKSVVEKGIKTRVRKDRNGNVHTDYEAYFGTDPFSKTAVRKTRSSMEELMKDIKDFYQRHSAGGDAAVRLTAVQALDAKNALDELAKARASISLTEAVRAFLSGSTCVPGANNGKLIGAAYAEFCDGKKNSSDADRVKVVATVGRWIKDYGSDKRLSSVTAKDVLNYLQANFITKTRVDKKTGKKTVVELKPKTYNSHLLYLNTFFNWCTKEERAYLPKNPVKSLKYREEPWVEPEYIKPDVAEKLMRLVEAQKDNRPDMLAYECLNLYCGTRDIEVMRIAEMTDAAKINLDDETIRIAKGKGFQLGRKPRAFHIPDTALAWMRSFDFAESVRKITPETKSDIYALARKNGLTVFHNFGRHTFITYHVAAYGDPAKTQAIVGTSEKMRAENYCGLASKADGEAFFRIMPLTAAKTMGLEY